MASGVRGVVASERGWAGVRRGRKMIVRRLGKDSVKLVEDASEGVDRFRDDAFDRVGGAEEEGFRGIGEGEAGLLDEVGRFSVGSGREVGGGGGAEVRGRGLGGRAGHAKGLLFGVDGEVEDRFLDVALELGLGDVREGRGVHGFDEGDSATLRTTSEVRPLLKGGDRTGRTRLER